MYRGSRGMGLGRPVSRILLKETILGLFTKPSFVDE